MLEGELTSFTVYGEYLIPTDNIMVLD